MVLRLISIAGCPSVCALSLVASSADAAAVASQPAMVPAFHQTVKQTLATPGPFAGAVVTVSGSHWLTSTWIDCSPASSGSSLATGAYVHVENTAVPSGVAFGQGIGNELTVDADTALPAAFSALFYASLSNGKQFMIQASGGDAKSCAPMTASGPNAFHWNAVQVATSLASSGESYDGCGSAIPEQLPDSVGTTQGFKLTLTACAATGKGTEPMLSGLARIGRTLQIEEVDPTEQVIYQWQRSRNGATWTPIPDANQPSYLVQSGDVGQRLRAVVTLPAATGQASLATNASAVVPTELHLDCQAWKLGPPTYRQPIPSPDYWPTTTDPNLEAFIERSLKGQSQTADFLQLVAILATEHPYWWYCDGGTGAHKGDHRPGETRLTAAMKKLTNNLKNNNDPACQAMGVLTGVDWEGTSHCVYYLNSQGTDFANMNNLGRVHDLTGAISSGLYCVAAFVSDDTGFGELVAGIADGADFQGTVGEATQSFAIRNSSETLQELYERAAKLTGLSSCTDAIGHTFQLFHDLEPTG